MADDIILTDDHVIAWARLVRATTTVMQAVETALKRAGLPPLVWYDLLLELRRAAPDGLRPLQLQKEMLIPQYNMSRLLDRIEAAGYVARAPCDEDGRGQVVTITDAGLDLLGAMWPVYRAALAETFASRIGEGDAARLAALLGGFGRAAAR